MLALSFSALIVAFIVFPDSLFRFILGWFVPVRAFQGTRAEQITRAVATLLFLFSLAWLLVCYVPGFRSWPFNVPESLQQRTTDYTTVASGLYSEPMFQAFGQRFWESLWRVLFRQMHLLFWYYILVIAAALLAGVCSRHYGSLRRNRTFARFADFYLLPHISQWHPILTGFTFPGKTTIRADALMTDGTLYRGEVAQYFLDNNGGLAGLILKDPVRFDRPLYLQERADWGTTRPIASFWRRIPSARLYLVGSQILNLNVNYEPEQITQPMLEQYVSGTLDRPVQVTITMRTVPPNVRA